MSSPDSGDGEAEQEAGEAAEETAAEALSAAAPSSAGAADEPADGIDTDAAFPPERRIEALEAELAELDAQYARSVADYQNLRRRSEEGRREQVRVTLASMLARYLPVFDDLDRAIESVDEEIAEHPWVEGIRAVGRKFQDTLEASGVVEIVTLGEDFDPNVHEAVSYAPGPEGQVIAVVRRGFSLDGHVIRVPMVVVGDGREAADPLETTQAEGTQ